MAQLCSLYVNAHLEKGHRQVMPMEFVFDPEARQKQAQVGAKQTPQQQQAIFETWAAAMNAKNAAPLDKRGKTKPHGN